MSNLSLMGAGPESGGAAFSPSSITGLQAWYKADAGTSTTTDGVAVSQWDDQSGNARHIVQATGGFQPLYKAAIQNGKPAIRFDGSDDALAVTGALTAKHVFAVAKYSAATFVGFDGLAGGTVVGDTAVLVGNQATANFFDDTPTTLYRKNATDFAEASMAGPMNAFAYMDISCAAGFTMSGVRIGNDRSNGGRNWLGDICEVYIYDTVLSAADRNSNESYLAAKYAL